MDSWDFEDHLDDLDYMPLKNNFFDILQYEGVAELQIHEGDLDSENLNAYLSKSPDIETDHPLAGGLRLIYSCVDSELDCSDTTVFWSRSDFTKIIESFHLPKRFTQMLEKCHCTFSQPLAENLSSEIESFSYIFSTLFHHNPLWALAASYDPSTNTTYAFLHLLTDRNSIPRLKSFLTKSAPTLLHPLLLPLLIIDLETALTLNDDEEWTSEISDIEHETRQKPRVQDKIINPWKLDVLSLVQRLNGCIVFLSLIERESEAVLLHLDVARRMLSELSAKSPKLAKAGKGLARHVDFLVESRKNLVLRLRNLERRGRIQLQFLYNFIPEENKISGDEEAADQKVCVSEEAACGDGKRDGENHC